jgi:hypothetical protein
MTPLTTIKKLETQKIMRFKVHVLCDRSIDFPPRRKTKTPSVARRKKVYSDIPKKKLSNVAELLSRKYSPTNVTRLLKIPIIM